MQAIRRIACHANDSAPRFFASAAPKYAPSNDSFARRRVPHPDAFHWTAATGSGPKDRIK
ncbi:hypothetical protein A8D95_30710 [Burkholderia cenocepacia]|jgi:hypothetical protein|uniref:Uncharacterized protein n=1 Tax=Burkholderia cenocepacia TaxID=95486 RepID=A0A1V2VQ16_9BURK|nr:hypothetical protein A8D61_00205 [Burkholderia cenocepacia]CDN62678.1 hypothetical protein I35_4842 [Burkholderia cenocepacia H111]AQQ46061.1 hypothetical protein A8F32_09345 [Burkholderia cenocepacia]ARF87748.1 uncharacterized protein BCN122_II1005 [Burkholderia cenocepacia]ONI96352.1 hypothetical protein A8F33_29260 [Burkholderia cenocepacia]